MAILGNIIKGVIGVTDSISGDSDPVKEQEDMLIELLTKAKDTAFGKFHDFESILNATDPVSVFANTIPYYDYNAINDKWWHRLHQGEMDVTWPGHPTYFAISSGTTGKTSKKIPVTDDMIDALRGAGIAQVLAFSKFDFPADFYEKELMMFGSSTNLQENNNHLEGEISGISTSNIPFWFKGYYKPGEEIAKIEDWDERVEAVAKNAKNWDIGAISGIPSWIELMLEKVIAYHGLNNIHEIWPNFTVFTSGGVAFGPYEKSFNSLLGKPITVIDTYLASEGFIAFQARPDTDAMALVTNQGI